MFLERQIDRLSGIYREYPRTFWTLMLVSFIDGIGKSLLFPFFALYLTARFGVGMSQVGVLFTAFAVCSMIGSTIGGGLTDRLGRRKIIIFGLITSSASSLVMGLADSFMTFFAAAVFVGILADSAVPARAAMVADLLPEEKRASGYGILRVTSNLTMVIGPVIGGFLATRSYLALFAVDAAVSLAAVLIILRRFPETRPAAGPAAHKDSMAGTFRGYFRVLRDSVFLFFIGASLLMELVYVNMNTTLGVYLRDAHHVPVSAYGLIIGLNALMVVFFQFPITRLVMKKAPAPVMALGAVLYAVGFAMYGFVSAYLMFALAMIIITLGEMLVVPVSQALAAAFAPADMRGRYIAVYTYTWSIPGAVGPILAGLILDGPSPDWLWYAAGILGCLSAICFLILHRYVNARRAGVPPD